MSNPTLSSNPNICYCGEYGGGRHTRSAKCPPAEQPTSNELLCFRLRDRPLGEIGRQAAEVIERLQQENDRLVSDNEANRDMLDDARLELDMVREALGVPVEPHQNLHERILEAAGHAHEPPPVPAADDHPGVEYADSTADEPAAIPDQDTEKLAWAQLAYEDGQKYLDDDNGQSIHVRQNRALGILFDEIQRLEKMVYLRPAQPPTAATQFVIDALSECERWHSGDKWRHSNEPHERRAWEKHQTLLARAHDTLLSGRPPSTKESGQ